MSKNPYTTDFRVSIDILPFSENEYKFDRLILDEIVGGELAGGEVNLSATNNIDSHDKFFNTQSSVNIKIKQADPKKELDIYGFITERKYSPGSGEYYFKFVCTPLKGSTCYSEFYTLTKTKRYKNLKKAIEGAWGDKRIRFECDTDLEDIDIFQDRESDHTFLKKLCYSYKENTIFGFDFDGLFIKDLFGIDRENGEQEPSLHRSIIGGNQVQSDDEISRMYNYDLYHKIENPIEDGDDTTLSKNFDVEVMNDQYRIYRKDTTRYQRNGKYNRRLMNSTMGDGLVVRFTNKLPPFQLGDTIYYYKAFDEKMPEGQFGELAIYLVSRIYFYITTRPEWKEDNETFLVKAVFRGVEDPLGNKLPFDGKTGPGNIGTDFAGENRV